MRCAAVKIFLLYSSQNNNICGYMAVRIIVLYRSQNICSIRSHSFSQEIAHQTHKRPNNGPLNSHGKDKRLGPNKVSRPIYVYKSIKHVRCKTIALLYLAKLKPNFQSRIVNKDTYAAPHMENRKQIKRQHKRGITRGMF